MPNGQSPYPPPPGYGMPPPPGYAARYQSATEKGVRFFNWSLILQFLMALIGFIIALITVIAVFSATEGDFESSAFGLGAALVGLGCILLLIMVLVFIFIIIGCVNFSQGKREFPGKHSTSVTLGIVFFVLWIIMFICMFIIPIVMIVSAGLSGDISSLGSVILIIAVLSFLASLFIGLMYLFMIKEIALPVDRKLLMIGFILLIISGIISISIVAVVTTLDIGDLTTDQAQSISSSIQNIGAIASLIGYVLFLIAYRHTLKAIEAGQIKPTGMLEVGPHTSGASYPPPPPPPGY